MSKFGYYFTFVIVLLFVSFSVFKIEKTTSYKYKTVIWHLYVCMIVFEQNTQVTNKYKWNNKIAFFKPFLRLLLTERSQCVLSWVESKQLIPFSILKIVLIRITKYIMKWRIDYALKLNKLKIIYWSYHNITLVGKKKLF